MNEITKDGKEINLDQKDLEQIAGGREVYVERTCKYIAYVDSLKDVLDFTSYRMLSTRGRDACYLHDEATMLYILDQCAIDSIFTQDMYNTILEIFNS